MTSLRTTWLQPTPPEQLLRRRAKEAQATASPAFRRRVARIVDAVLRGGTGAALAISRRFGDPGPEAVAARTPRSARAIERAWPFLDRRRCRQALDRLSREDRQALERAAARVRAFAEAQRAAIRPVRERVAGLSVGHRLVPLPAAGCYAPGGRYPLPSSVLMTAIPARVAGVPSVWVATPRPVDATLAAAALADADGVVAVGGAQGIALLARGDGPLPPSAIVVGPGSRSVTLAKSILRERGRVAIDGLAGPSELLVVADDRADPELIAADLLAQAEHDPEARVWLVLIAERSRGVAFLRRVERACREQLVTLPTKAIATASMARAGAALVRSATEAVALANALAPEHLELLVRRPERLVPSLTSYGAIFVGEAAAEVFGDYGVGPNHTLPTAGSARAASGLSVFDFVRARTFLEGGGGSIAPSLVLETARLARLEGLEAHARAAERRSQRSAKRSK